MVIAHAIPEGASFVAGSSRLDGQPIADPRRGASGTLYWTLPGSQKNTVLRGSVTYTLAHTGALPELPAPALLARYGGERSEVLQGRVDAADLAAAAALSAPEQRGENAGAIKLPLSGSDVRIRDRIGVVVELPVGTQSDLSVNGTVIGADRIGQTTEDGPRGVTRLVYVGVPLNIGPNVLTFAGQSVTVNRVGPTAKVEVLPESLVADGSTPLRLRVRALDAFGRLSSQSSVTLRSNLEPRTPDANPGEAEYQLRLTDGEGLLELQPQASPGTLKLDLLQGANITRQTYAVTPGGGRVGVGMVSATLGLDGNLNLQDDLEVQARASYEGPLAGGKIYIAADKDGLPTERDTLKRYSLFGDSSVESVPLQGSDPVAVEYDHPAFHAQYRRAPLPIDVLPVGEQFTALSANTKGNPQVSGFVALVPEARVKDERVVPEGTRILRLKNGEISPGSETLEVVTLEETTGKELARVRLLPNVDYQLDRKTGIVTLTRALDRVDATLNDVVVLASYRLENENSQRKLAYGAQATYTGQNFAVGVAAVSLDATVTFGARARYANGDTRADGLLAYSGGLQASLDANTKLGGSGLTGGDLGFKVRYQDAGYAGLAAFTPGLTVNGTYDARITRTVRAIVEADYHRNPAPPSASQTDNFTTGGNVSARAEVVLSPFSVGGGLKVGFGDQTGISGIVSGGYHRAPLDVDVVHTQPFSGEQLAETRVGVRYRLGKVTLGLTDKYTWGVGHTAGLTLDSTLGRTNYAVAYDLPTAGGQGNRARFGVTTTLPLNARTTLGLRGSAVYDIAGSKTELGAGADLNYKSETVSATAGTDLVLNDKGFGVVIRAGVAGQLTPHLTLRACL
ncbi:Outer membrane protein beta-barrel family protein [Deinococcus marmoris]